MSWFNFVRAIAQGFGRATLVHFAPKVSNQVCIVRPRNIIRNVWQNLTSPGYHSNNFAADLRRRATQNFLRRNATKFPMLAFAGFCLSDSNGNEREASSTSLCDYLRSDLDRFWKDEENAVVFPPKFNIGEYGDGVNSDDCDGDKAFEREHQTLPCTEKSSGPAVADIVLEQESDQNNMILPVDPSILKLPGKCIDDTPSVHDSTVPKVLHHHCDVGSNTCTLREYLDANKNVLSTEERVCIFCQLLEGVAQLERCIISHRDLKSDNILVEYNEDGFLRVRIKGEDTLLACNRQYDNTGGNFTLLAPEIANAIPCDRLHLDYSKAYAWACGGIAYEIFDQDNPFYTYLQNTDYEDEILVEIPVYSGYQLIDKVVRGLLRNDPEKRLSACDASTMAMMLNTPDWLASPHMVTQQDVERWLLVSSINTKRKGEMCEDKRLLPPDILLNMVFLSRITSTDILRTLVLVSELQKG